MNILSFLKQKKKSSEPEKDEEFVDSSLSTGSLTDFIASHVPSGSATQPPVPNQSNQPSQTHTDSAVPTSNSANPTPNGTNEPLHVSTDSAVPTSNSAIPTQQAESPLPTPENPAAPPSNSAMPTSASNSAMPPSNSAMPTSNSAMPTSNSAMPRMTYDELAAGESASPSPADFPPSDSDSVLYHAVPAGSDDDETPLTGSPIPAELTGKSAQSKRSPRDLLPHFGETGETGETGEDETPALPADFSEEFSVRFQKLPNESENRDKSKGVSMGTRLKNAWNRILDEDGEDDKKKKKRREKKGGIPAKTAEAGNGSAGSVGNGENGAGGSAGSADLQSTGVKKGKWEIETSA